MGARTAATRCTVVGCIGVWREEAGRFDGSKTNRPDTTKPPLSARQVRRLR